MKLNIGCSWPEGRYKQDEWTNFDIIKNKRVNLVGSVLDIPLPTCSVEEIHCVHLLEHLTRDKYPLALAEMHRVLKPDGVLYVETPDFHGTVINLAEAFEAGDTEAVHIWTTSTYGKSEREGMSHYWGFYEGLLRRAFRHQGFTDVVRLTDSEDMISTHYKQEPILLVRGAK